MSFQDFKGIWKIVGSDDEESECETHRVAIGGSEQAVLVLCCDAVDTHRYDGCHFDGTCIVGNGFTIRMGSNGGATTLTCRPGAHSSTGTPSWTAEDPGGHPGGEGGDEDGD